VQHEPARRRILALGSGLVLLHLGFRAWALYPSWFVIDDYRLLEQARAASLGPGYLFAPFDGHLMPLGRLLVWLVERSGEAPWAVTATSTLVLQALAAAACLRMLVTLFGARWAVLGLLALYLTSAVPLPATMWWAASLISLPLQTVLFVAVGAWVRHLRTDGRRWLAVTAGALVVGLSTDTKSLLVVGVLGWLLLAYFGRGRGPGRVVGALRRHLPAALLIGSMTLAYVAYYVLRVPSPTASPTAALARDLAGNLVGRSLATGLLGGPWRWGSSNPPLAGSDPPGWAVALSWLVLVTVVVVVARTRRRAGRAGALLVLYAAVSYVLLLVSRAPAFGAELGLQMRYLTDVHPVAVLCLGLALLPLVGAVESSAPRDPARATGVPAPRLLVPLAAAVCVGGLVSSTGYVRIFHGDNPGATWARNAIDGLDARSAPGPVALADQVVPPAVVPRFAAPYNSTRRVLPVLVGGVEFPEVTEDLVTLTDAGEPRRAQIDPAVRSLEGPEPGCGWRVSGPRARTVPLEAPAFDYVWWVRVGYLGSAADTVTITAGDALVTASVRRGLHTLFFRVVGEVPSVRISGLAPGSTLCVDTVEVGDIVPGDPL